MMRLTDGRAWLLALTGALFVGVVVIVASITRHGGESRTAGQPTTATADAAHSPWKGRLPDPCATLPQLTLTRLQLEASSGAAQNQNDGSQIRNCTLFASGGQTWTSLVSYSTTSFDEAQRIAEDPTRYVTRATMALGHPAFRSTPRAAERATTECTITAGTVFGTVAYRVWDESSPSADAVCAKATELAVAFYPSVRRGR
ncbi:DUF3558 family protein [Gordonia crocea]|uniref:DUF3558 domain-containing protein n=1 Tax=Gordonia crocea TaxID=589162 RepID=A0A7I9V0I5_9ACTN|nr:DUF3558 family protein [Gordonia crocea]GED98682.1 hypothetical protein nbrc107697_27210 [Gordonia crocea]